MNKQRGQDVNKREEFWDNLSKQSNSFDVIYDADFSKALKITHKELSQINNVVFDILYYSLTNNTQREVGSPQNHQQIIDYLDKQISFSVNFPSNANRFVQLENLLLETMQKRGLLQQVVGIQFPIDVRVVQATAPPGYLDRRDAIDFMHCDGWRGEPNDGVNCLLYSHAPEGCSRLHILDLPKNRLNTMAKFKGDEKNTGGLLDGLQPIDFKHEPGIMIFFDSYAPHKVLRQGKSTRISLNFSLRRNDPYQVLDDRWGRDRQSWDKYWYLPTQVSKSFEARCSNEVDQLLSQGKTEAATLRKQYITQKLLKNSSEVY